MGADMTRFKLEKLISTGHSGDVYRARLHANGRQVAVKVYRQSGLSSSRSQLLRELSNLVRLPEHQNVAQFLGVTSHHGEIALVQEWVDGVTLGTFMRRPLPLNVCIFLLRQLLLGLAECVHMAGLVHRDLSPSNIMISSDGTVKLVDFGLSRADGAAQTSGAIQGTPGHMSPEHVCGEPLYATSDLFAVGILFYELVTQESLFVGTGEEISVAVTSPTQLPSVRTSDPCLPDWLDSMLSRLLAKDAEARYQSAGDVLRDLPESVRGRESTVQILQEIGAYREREHHNVRRPWLALVAGAAMASALLLLTTWFASSPAVIDQPVPSDERVSKESPAVPSVPSQCLSTVPLESAPASQPSQASEEPADSTSLARARPVRPAPQVSRTSQAQSAAIFTSSPRPRIFD